MAGATVAPRPALAFDFLQGIGTASDDGFQTPFADGVANTHDHAGDVFLHAVRFSHRAILRISLNKSLMR
jgi:hypothetical protein